MNFQVELDREVGRVLKEMQRPEQRRGMDRLLSMTGRELGEAAVRGVVGGGRIDSGQLLRPQSRRPAH